MVSATSCSGVAKLDLLSSSRMVHSCAVSGCHSRSDRETHLAYTILWLTHMHVHFVLNILNSDEKVQFYTGFPSRQHLEICFSFLGPSVNCLQYWGSKNSLSQQGNKCGRKRKLSPLEEFVMTYKTTFGAS